MMIRITQKGWHKFNGDIGGVQFVDGVSSEHISPREAQALGSYIAVVQIDDDGTDGNPINPAWDMVRTETVRAPVKKKLPTLKDIQDAEKARLVEAGEEVDVGFVRYTKAQLEAIADKDGIAGIRAIATPLGVKGVAVRQLISEILARQGPLA